MANTFLTANAPVIAQTALSALYKQLVLPQLVWRDVANDLRPGLGGTVTIPKPAVLTARTFNRAAGTPITLDEVAETGVNVVIDKHLYSAVGIPDEDNTLNIADFARQILVPQTQAVSQDVEAGVASVFTALAATNDITVPRDKPVNAIPKAWQYLTTRNVPQTGRYLVMGAEFAATLLADDKVSRADAAGEVSALRAAAFSPLFGFQPFESNAIPADQAFAFTREAVALVTKTPSNPRGATASELVNQNGIQMRWLSDYDAAYLRDRSIVSILFGASLVDANRVVRLKLAAAS
ncbi:P22 phage major capsid protein family protein [Pseudonocardia alni]|uniref:P22 phage major capsid protein family protein n=1 Tax=Pseudonocardia alni TaxID=33907 RepID=UPI00332293D9